MAKAPWEKYSTPSSKTAWATKKAVRAARPVKTPQQKMLEQIAKQFEYLNDPMAGRKSWFRLHSDGDVVKAQVRYGSSPLKISGDSTYVEMPIEKCEEFLNDIRDAVENSNRFDAQLKAISDNMSKRRTKG